MKISEDRQDVLVGGAESVDAFTIKASAKAFQILSSNLYSNPLGSMIRELSTNAYDAHVMTDKADEPFLITLPNSLEPTFKIRDFGPGLSHNEIMSVYTTFFESTKTNSNDVVGCLGLGSKSPFGVADSFTVTSFHGGKKTIYSAFLNDARIPSIAKFGETDTDEENGIEIEVAIRESDFYTFNREVNNQLKYFKVKPEVKGSSDFEWNPDEQYIYEGDDWKMVRDGHRDPRVIQGQIAYPISTHDMGSVYTNAPPAVRELLGRAVLFEVPIGDVNIAPSREALSYDDRTSENIVAAAERILKDLPPQIKEAIQNSKTEYEARILYSEIMSTFGHSYYHRSALSKHIADSGEILWKGKDVSETDIKINGLDIDSATNFTKHYNGRWQKSNYNSHGDWGADKKDRNWEFTVSDLKNTVWVYTEDGDKAVEGRAKQYAAEKYGRDIKLNIIKVAKGMTPQKLANRMGFKKSTLVIAADLPKVKRAPKTSAPGKKEVTIPMFRDWEHNKSEQWDGEKIEKIDLLTGYYVNLDRFDVMNSNGKIVKDFKQYVSGARELKLIDSDAKIYGLRKANQKRKHNLVDLFEHISTNAPKLTLKTRYKLCDNSDVVRRMDNSISHAKDLASKLDDESPLKKIIMAVIANNTDNYNSPAMRLIKEFELESNQIDMSAEAEKMDKLYPMIGEISGYYFNIQIVTDYVIQMDMLRKMIADSDEA